MYIILHFLKVVQRCRLKRKDQYGSSNIKWMREENQLDGYAQIRLDREEGRQER